MSHDLAAILHQEPQPTITITCEKRTVRGREGFMLLPQIRFTHMPGTTLEAWGNVHRILAQCLSLVADEMVKEAQGQGQPRVQVVPAVPGAVLKH